MLASILALHLLGQTPYVAGRYDMGVRLQLVDDAWTKASARAKDAAVPKLSAAVSGFFGGKSGEVCRALDEARAILGGVRAELGWAQTFRPAKPIFEGAEAICFRGDWCYHAESENAAITPVVFRDRIAKNRFGVADIAARMPNGQIVHGTWVENWAAVRDRLEGLTNPTAKTLATRIRVYVENPSSWSHAPVLADWITAAFRLDAGELDQMRELPRVERAGIEFRIAFPHKTGLNTDVMIALHGAGGEADMFFESYGSGVWPKRATEAGMIFASPTTSAQAPAAVLDWLEKVRKVKPKRVFLVGHSMGGGAAIAAAAAMREKPTAMILLAPAAANLPPTLKGVPTLLCVGESEMMMIRNMAGRLKEAVAATPGGKSLTTPHAEHLMVAAESVGPAFRWLESIPR